MMKAALVLVILCLCFEGRRALPSCAAGEECPENAQCTVAVGTCACNAGYHENSDSTACVADIAPGQECQTKDSETECMDGALCTNVTQTSTAVGTLKCTCKAGYHLTSDATDCAQDKNVGVRCEKTTPGECAEGSTCTGTGLNVHKCGCSSGFHEQDDMNGIIIRCVADKAPGSACTIDNEECIENSTCKATTDSSVLCTCNQDFHDVNGTCTVDTCVHTHEKCTAAGVADCTGANTFVHCMLAGNCDPADETELMRFKTALNNVKSHFTDNCAYSASETCTEKVTGCINAFLKQNEMCTTIRGLKTCMDAFNSECETSKEVKLASALQAYLVTNHSCECIEAVETCHNTYKTQYDADAADNATKCSATRQLLTCGLSTPCDVTLPADSEALSTLVSMAFWWTQNITCDAPEPTTCSEQLAVCVVVIEDQSDGDALKKCRAIENFGTCVKGDKCGADDASKTRIFMEHYNATSSTCKCPIKLDSCNDSAQIIPANPTVACGSKLVTYATCIMGAECSLVAGSNDEQPLKEAHEFYRTLRTNRTCQLNSSDPCEADLVLCSNNLIESMVNANDIAVKCSKTGESLLCVNGASCRDDAALLASRDAAKFRLRTIGCSEPSCNVTNDELEVCADKYKNDMNTATSDSNKCTVRNTFVGCLRRMKCNNYMKTNIDKKYKDIGKETFPGCKLQTLDGPGNENAARSLSVDLLPVLLATLGALAATAARL